MKADRHYHHHHHNGEDRDDHDKERIGAAAGVEVRYIFVIPEFLHRRVPQYLGSAGLWGHSGLCCGAGRLCCGDRGLYKRARAGD